MKKILLSLVTVLIPVLALSQATDLFFSEYLEGSSSNKYIEIFNGTGSTVNLADYQVLLFSNGKPESDPSQTLTLADIDLPNNSVYTIGNSGGTLFTADITSAVTYFNGNDALALKKISTSSYVDIIGCIGEDPGSAWTDGDHSTANKTLVRKASVTSGVTTNPSSGFPTLASEWTVYDQDFADDLGTHTFSTTVGTVELTTPNGGESYAAGQAIKFMWNSTDVSNVYFEVWTPDLMWDRITDNIPSVDGANEYDFTIPANAFTWDAYKLRVVDADNPAVVDESNATFAIDGHDTELFWESFEGGQFNSTMQYSVLGAKTWVARTGYAEINGYDNQNQEDEEDWLITNAINLDNTKSEILAFETAVDYDSPNSGLQLYYSTDYAGSGDPSSATWNTLNATFATSTAFTHSGYIDISGISGNVYFGFKYMSTAAEADKWMITNIEVSGVDDTSTSIEDAETAKVIVSPNPFNKELFFSTTKAIQQTILVNTAGQMVKRDASGSKRVNTADLAKGLYILKIDFVDGTSKTLKVIKK